MRPLKNSTARLKQFIRKMYEEYDVRRRLEDRCHQENTSHLRIKQSHDAIDKIMRGKADGELEHECDALMAHSMRQIKNCLDLIVTAEAIRNG